MTARMTVFEFYTADEVDTKFSEANERLVAALEALVTQTMLAQALSGLAVKTEVVNAIAEAVAAAVEPLASRLWTQAAIETAKAAAIREATNGRPNWTETNKRLNDLLAPIIARIAALEARIV